jgi:methylated-DNA-[protein]-cysteine S-methyltransferase
LKANSTSPVDGLRFDVFETAFGWVAIMGSHAGVVGTTLPHATPSKAFLALGIRAQSATHDPEAVADLARRMQAYFRGEKIEFADALDVKGTSFQLRVWAATRGIPYGQTVSYREVAVQSGSPLAARASGQALGANPVPIIVPCHRVLSSDGTLGGFGGGLDMKTRLLAMERR